MIEKIDYYGELKRFSNSYFITYIIAGIIFYYLIEVSIEIKLLTLSMILSFFFIMIIITLLIKIYLKIHLLIFKLGKRNIDSLKPLYLLCIGPIVIYDYDVIYVDKKGIRTKEFCQSYKKYKEGTEVCIYVGDKFFKAEVVYVKRVVGFKDIGRVEIECRYNSLNRVLLEKTERLFIKKDLW